MDCSRAADAGSASETTSSDEAEIRFADADDPAIPGSDYRAVDQPGSGPSAQESQESSSLASAAVPPKKSEFHRAVLGVFALLVGVLAAAMAWLAGDRCESFHALCHALTGRSSALILGAIPLVYARGRNAIGTVICSAFVLVVFIIVLFPQGAHGIDIQIPGQPCSLLFEPQRYDLASPSVTEFLDQQKAVLYMVTQGETSEFETKW